MKDGSRWMEPRKQPVDAFPDDNAVDHDFDVERSG